MIVASNSGEAPAPPSAAEGAEMVRDARAGSPIQPRDHVPAPHCERAMLPHGRVQRYALRMLARVTPRAEKAEVRKAVAATARNRCDVVHVRTHHSPAVDHFAQRADGPSACVAAAVRSFEHEHAPQLPVRRIRRPEAEQRLDDARPDRGETRTPDHALDPHCHPEIVPRSTAGR
jgi:hypothetical protein